MSKATKALFALVWGWLVELVLSVLLVLAVGWIWNAENVAAFLMATASDWLTVTGQVLFPASVAIWITYVNLASAEFGDYLRFINRERGFSAAFVFPVFVFFLSTISLIFYRGTNAAWLLWWIVFVLAYSTALTISLVGNLTSLVRLYGAFKGELRKELAREERGKGNAAANDRHTRLDK